ncbi:hypothetical protein ANO11243_084710 [Dothideomycetidae sp. 11243]|nr:hypothetical protein ANO11243_084710 [fungal sp. No.11243]
MVPELAGGKMSSSDTKSKVDLLDHPDTVRLKIKKAPCTPRMVQGNGILAFIQHVVLPHSALLASGGKPALSVVLHGNSETIVFSSFADVVTAYEADF